MAKKADRQTRIEGDVKITDGDFVTGDKTITYGVGEPDPGSGKPPGRKPRRKPAAKERDLHENLEVSGGDVVFGDKIIKFFQENLNIYLFRDVRQLALFLVFVLLVAGGIGVATWILRQPRTMTGDYNIAIARFGEIQPDGSLKSSARAAYIRNSLFNFLDSEYRASGLGLTVQVTHKNMPLIEEDSDAEELANRINADIVIYGNIYADEDLAELSPRFFVAEKDDTQELTGQNELGFPIPFKTSELQSQAQVNQELKTRAAILLNFTKALVYNARDEQDKAWGAIQASMRAAEKITQPFEGREVIYLVACKIQAARKNYDAAGELIEQALQINPQYARGYLARGNVYYSRALESDFDPALLDQALTQYQTAYGLPDQPESANIPIRAHTMLGNIYVVKAQMANDPALFEQAAGHYQYVIDEYNKTPDPFLLRFVSTAYFGMGAYYERQGMTEQAIQSYQKAAELTEDPDFKARIEDQIQKAKK